MSDLRTTNYELQTTNYKLQTSFLRTAALALKELRSWVYSPALYGITVFFLLFVSVWFFYLQRFFAMDMTTLRPFFTAFPIAYILVIPVLTMRAWAEEKKLGSAEILFTLPFTEWELVMGKFISVFILLSAMLLLTIPVPLSLVPLGYFDPGVIFSEYLGAFLLGAAAAALGLFLSCISKNQAAAFLGTAVALVIVILMSSLSGNLPPSLAAFVNFISLSFHFESFSRGLLDSRDLSFFLLSALLFLFLNVQVLVFRRWKS